MSYLLDFIKSLDESEFSQFALLDLKGKEEMVRDVYSAHKTTKQFDESLLHSQLGLSKAHFDKITSILLDKALDSFAGTEEDKLRFLMHKQLGSLVLHELKVGEKRLKKERNPEVLKNFYGEAFRTLILFNFNEYPLLEIEYFKKLYVKSLSHGEEEERCRVLAKYNEMVLRYYYGRKGGVVHREKSVKELLRLQKEVEGKNMPVAETAIYLGLSSYHEWSDREKSLYYLQLAHVSAARSGGKINEREQALVLAMMAKLLLDLSRFEESRSTYEQLFQQFESLTKMRIYHPFQYVFSLLILKDLPKAHQMMEKYLRPFLENPNARNVRFDILRLYAIYHLFNNEADKAGDYLQQILQFGKEDFTITGDILFRLVHNVYCIQTGDYALALVVHKKNMKFINSKLELEGMPAYKPIFESLGKVVRFKFKGGVAGKDKLLSQIPVGDGSGRLYQDLIRLPLQ